MKWESVGNLPHISVVKTNISNILFVPQKKMYGLLLILKWFPAWRCLCPNRIGICPSLVLLLL